MCHVLGQEPCWFCISVTVNQTKHHVRNVGNSVDERTWSLDLLMAEYERDGIMLGLQMYNRGHSMATAVFWRYSVMTAVFGGAVCFFFPYYATVVRLPLKVAHLLSQPDGLAPSMKG